MAANIPHVSFCRWSLTAKRNSAIQRGTLEPAKIDWSTPGTPVSARHRDVYFNAGNGLEETRHVFLAGNNLPEAWRGRRVFVIGETGFGTGLNFLAAWALWRRTAPPGARLHFVSVEGFPLTRDDLERAHRPFAELALLSRQLRAAWPHLYSGFHRRHFDDDRVTLTLLFGEAADMLGQLDAQVDAWFLDGFSPASNPDFWRQEILERIGALTRPGGSASSFTVAGSVRRGMEAAGFEVGKAPGFGRKRNMMRARRRGRSATVPYSDIPATALVIGAGLAGSSAAHALARRDVAVTLIDPDPELHCAASGNPAGLVYPRPTADASAPGRFHCAAFDYAETHVFNAASGLFDPCGVLELAVSDQACRRHRALASGRILPASAVQALTAEEAAQAAAVNVPVPALHFPHGGIVRPVPCAGWLRGQTGVQKAMARDLIRTDQGWTVRLEDGDEVTADIAVLACGNGASAFTVTDTIPITASRGQLSIVPANTGSGALRKALSFGAYVSPALEGHHLLGATYDDTGWPPAAGAKAEKLQDHERNYAALRHALPDFPLPPPDPGWRGRVAFRCTTPDRLPLLGQLPALSHQPDLAVIPPDGMEVHIPYKENLYLYAGLGSRGVTTAPLLGELLASIACQDPLPTESDVTDLLHPARFLARALRKNGLRLRL